VHKEGLVHREVQLAGRDLLLFFSAGQKTKGTPLLGNLTDNTRSNIICNFCHPIVVRFQWLLEHVCIAWACMERPCLGKHGKASRSPGRGSVGNGTCLMMCAACRGSHRDFIGPRLTSDGSPLSPPSLHAMT